MAGSTREQGIQHWVENLGRYVTMPAAVASLLQRMELKLLAKLCGFAHIKPEKPHIAVDTPMEDPAYRLQRHGLSQHLHGRLVCRDRSGTTAKVLARDLGMLLIDKQVGEIKGWPEQMAAQIPSEGGLSEAQRAEQQAAQNEAVLAV